jgi:hypothetical protein
MQANGTDQRPAAGSPAGPAVQFDRELTEHMSAALQSLVRPQAALPAKAPAESHGKKAEKAPSAWRAQFWSIVGALLVTAAAVTGLFAYKHLGDEMGQTRSETSKLRLELGQFRAQFLRKDEFSNRNLAVHALLQDTESKVKAAMGVCKDRLQDHKTALRESAQQVKELRFDVKRFEERLAAREKRDGIVPASPAGGVRPASE